MTSPVDRISGPKRVSTPGKRAKGSTASLTAKPLIVAGSIRLKFFKGSPAITRAAIAAIGLRTVLATKGTVRLARGFTSIRYISLSLTANCTFIRPITFSDSAKASV